MRPGTVISRRSVLALAAAAAALPAFAAAAAGQGRIETLDVPGQGCSPRVRVWLPPGYEDGGHRCRTLYMLDGQFSFAEDGKGQNFAADRRLAQLIRAGQVPPTLIVAMDNLEDDRFLQYMPQTIYDQAGPELRAAIDREMARTGGRPLVSRQFIEWLTGQLKLQVDRRYRTRPGRLDTAIFGASMAGVMSGAIFVEAQQAFGRAACLSPNWPIYDARFIDWPQLRTIWPDYFARLGAPAGRRLWLDHGTEMMDAGMGPHQTRIAERLTKLGWRPGRNLETRVHHGAGHAFAETAVQMDAVLGWLLA